MDNAESIGKVSANRPPTPWETETRRRWARLRALIAETESDLSRSTGFDEGKTLEASLRNLKRASLSVWVDARRAGIALHGVPSDKSSALVEG